MLLFFKGMESGLEIDLFIGISTFTKHYFVTEVINWNYVDDSACQALTWSPKPKSHVEKQLTASTHFSSARNRTAACFQPEVFSLSTLSHAFLLKVLGMRSITAVSRTSSSDFTRGLCLNSLGDEMYGRKVWLVCF